MDNVIIEKLSALNVKKVAEIEKECFPLPWSEQSLSYEIYNPDAEFYVLKFDDEIVAYGGFLTVIDEAHIMDIAVSGKFRGLGLSKLLLEKLIEVAYLRKLRAMTLEVRVSNFKAINLYEKYGFKLAGIRPKYYENTEDALIYWKTL